MVNDFSLLNDYLPQLCFFQTHTTAHIILHHLIGPKLIQTFLCCIFIIKQYFNYIASCAALKGHLCSVDIRVESSKWGFIWSGLERSLAAVFTWFSAFTSVCRIQIIQLFYSKLGGRGFPWNQCLQWLVWHSDFFCRWLFTSVQLHNGMETSLQLCA